MTREKGTKIFHLLFMLVGGSLGYYLLPTVWQWINQEAFILNNALVNIAIGAIIFYLLFILQRPWLQRVFTRLANQIRQLSLATFLTSLLGLIIGLILAWLINIPVIGFNVPFISNILPFILTVVLGFVGYVIGNTRSYEIQQFFVRVGQLSLNDIDKTKEKIQQRKATNNSTEDDTASEDSQEDNYTFQPYKILDTSVIIDGRILDVIRAGFIEGIILVPNFVLKELQFIADSADATKRVRGRRGLDILNQLRDEEAITVEFSDRDFEKEDEVDLKLLLLAKEVNGIVVTNDYNLNKVSQFHQIKVLNINELANALKMVVIPGDHLSVHIIKKGTERQQGVGYLDDGTMIVVEEGKKHLDETLQVEITSSLQTNAGKMIFAKIV
ncbi:PIN/TRAM domain-containing protein [Aerococcus suis]